MPRAAPTPAQRRRRGAILTAVGVVGMVACIIAFAATGYVGSRQEVFGGWIAGTFFGAVGFGIVASYGQFLRRRARRDEDA